MTAELRPELASRVKTSATRHHADSVIDHFCCSDMFRIMLRWTDHILLYPAEFSCMHKFEDGLKPP